MLHYASEFHDEFDRINLKFKLGSLEVAVPSHNWRSLSIIGILEPIGTTKAGCAWRWSLIAQKSKAALCHLGPPKKMERTSPRLYRHWTHTRRRILRKVTVLSIVQDTPHADDVPISSCCSLQGCWKCSNHEAELLQDYCVQPIQAVIQFLRKELALKAGHPVVSSFVARFMNTS
jgi:hypothetical protein